MIIVGVHIPSAILIPSYDQTLNILSLKTSWQTPSLLISSIICGSKSSLIAATAYLTIGLFYIPVFHGGGSIGYALTPEFGYLISFLPTSFLVGNLSKKIRGNKIIGYTLCSIVGLLIIHTIGIFNLLLGSLTQKWDETLYNMLFKYTIVPFFHQLLICPAVALIGITMKKILFIK